MAHSSIILRGSKLHIGTWIAGSLWSLVLVWVVFSCTYKTTGLDLQQLLTRRAYCQAAVSHSYRCIHTGVFIQVSLTCAGLQDRTNDMKPYNFSCPVFVTVCVNSIALYSMYTYWCRLLLKLHNVCVFLFILQPVAQLVCNVWNGLQVHSWSRGLQQIHNVMMCPDVVDLLWTVQEIHKLMKISR